MRVLLVESTPGNAREVARWLHEAGHQTEQCFGQPGHYGCRGVSDPASCPMDTPLDLTVLVRDFDGGQPPLTEMGAVCSLRHHLPVVELVEPDREALDATMLGALASVSSGRTTADYESAVHDAWVVRLGLDSDHPYSVSVTREPNRVHAVVELPAGTPAEIVPGLIDTAARALRRHDPFVRVIDIATAVAPHA
jgi:hypothetical protein